MTERDTKPVTHHVDVEQALATLDQPQMLALAAMFERWALTELSIDGEQRPRLIQWSADYEAIAAFAGADWMASDPSEPSLLGFIAGRELGALRQDQKFESTSEAGGPRIKIRGDEVANKHPDNIDSSSTRT